MGSSEKRINFGPKELLQSLERDFNCTLIYGWIEFQPLKRGHQQWMWPPKEEGLCLSSSFVYSRTWNSACYIVDVRQK